MQDNDERLGTRHPIKPAVMGFPADKVTCRMQTFESISLRPLRYVCLFSFYRTASHNVWKNARFRCKITMKSWVPTPDKARRYGISCGQGDLPDANFRVLPLTTSWVMLHSINFVQLIITACGANVNSLRVGKCQWGVSAMNVCVFCMTSCRVARSCKTSPVSRE